MAYFDVEAAKSYGYSDEEIARFLAEQNNFDLDSALGSGYSYDEVNSFLQGSDTDTAGFHSGTVSSDRPQPVAPDIPEEEKSFWGGVTSQAKAGFASELEGLGKKASEFMDLVNPISQMGGQVPPEISANKATLPFREAMNEIQQSEQYIADMNRPEGDFKKQVAFDALAAGMEMLPSILVSRGGSLAGKALPNAPLAVMGAQVYGRAYDEALSQGMSPEEAKAHAKKQVAFELVPEKLFGFFEKAGGFKTIRGMAANYVLKSAQEGGSEAATEILNILDEYDRGEIKDPYAVMGQLIERVGYAGLLGVVMGGGFTVAGAPKDIKGVVQDKKADAAFETDRTAAEQELQTKFEAAAGGLEQAAALEATGIVDKAGYVQEREKREKGAALADALDGLRQGAAQAAEQAVRPPVNLDLGQDQFNIEMPVAAQQGGVEVTAPTSVEGLDVRENAPLPPVVPPQDEAQGDLNLPYRQRDPESGVRDPADVPPVSPWQVDQALAPIDEGDPLEVAAAVRTHMTKKYEGQTILETGLRELDKWVEIYENEKNPQRWRDNAANEIRQIALSEFDRGNIREKVADRYYKGIESLKNKEIIEKEDIPSLETGEFSQEELDHVDYVPDEASRTLAARINERTEGKVGGWEVVGVDPETGFVHARFTGTTRGKEVTRDVFWKPDTSRDRWYRRPTTDEGTGAPIWKMGGSTRKGKPPIKWRKSVDALAKPLLTGEVRKTSVRMKGAVASWLEFQGALPQGTYVKQEIRRALDEAQARLPRGETLSKKEAAKVREEARKRAEGKQAETVERLKAELNSQEDGEATQWEKVPKDKQDKGANIETWLTEEALSRIERGVSTGERAYQVMPNGELRILDIVPTAKGKRYSVFVLGEGLNAYGALNRVNSGVEAKPYLLGTAGKTVSATVMNQFMKEQGVDNIPEAVRKARKSNEDAGAQKDELPDRDIREVLDAIYAIEEKKSGNKEQAAEKRRIAKQKREGTYQTEAEREAVVDAKVDKLNEQLAKKDKRAGEAAAIEEAQSLEELQIEEQKQTEEEQPDYLEPRPEAKGASFDAGVVRQEPPSRLADQLQNAVTAEERQLIVEAYGNNRAKAERAISELASVAENTYDADHKRVTKQGGNDARGNMSLELYVQSGANLTLRGQAQLAMVRAALDDALAQHPDMSGLEFGSFINTIKLYLMTNPDAPMYTELTDEQIKMAYAVGTSMIQEAKAPRGWKAHETVAADPKTVAELASILVEDFGMSPVGSKDAALEILYGIDSRGKQLKRAIPEGQKAVPRPKWIWPGEYNYETMLEINRARRLRGTVSAPLETTGSLGPASDRVVGKGKVYGAPRGMIGRQSLDQAEPELGTIPPASTRRTGGGEAGVGGDVTTEDFNRIEQVQRDLQKAIKDVQRGESTEAFVSRVVDQAVRAVEQRTVNKARAALADDPLIGIEKKLAELEALIQQPDIRRNTPFLRSQRVPATNVTAEDIANDQRLQELYEATYEESPIDETQLELDLSQLMELKNEGEPIREGEEEKGTTVFIPKEGPAKPKRKARSAFEKKKKKLTTEGEKRAEMFRKHIDGEPLFDGTVDVTMSESAVEAALKERAAAMLKKGPVAVDVSVLSMGTAWAAQQIYSEAVEEAKAQGKPSTPVTPEKTAAQSRTIPLDNPTAENTAAFDTQTAQDSQPVVEEEEQQEEKKATPKERALKPKKYKKGRRFPRLHPDRWFSRFMGLPKKAKVTLAHMRMVRGQSRAVTQRISDLWAQARTEMVRVEGVRWNGWNKAKDHSVLHYLQGTTDLDSVHRLTGYRIPESAIPFLDQIRAEIKKLENLGVETGTFATRRVIMAVKNGEGYLHRGVKHTRFTRRYSERAVEYLAQLYEKAYPTYTEEQLEKKSAAELVRIIGRNAPHLQEFIGARVVESLPDTKKTKIRVSTYEDPATGELINLSIASNRDGLPTGRAKDVLASKDQLLSILKKHPLLAGENARAKIREMLSSTQDEVTPRAASAGLGTDYSVQQARKLLKSESDMVYNALVRIRSQVNEEGKKLINENMREQTNRDLKTVMKEMRTVFPEQAERIDRILVEYELNKGMREALNEVTDAETVVLDTANRLVESISMSNFAADTVANLVANNLARFDKGDWVAIAPKDTPFGNTRFPIKAIEDGNVTATFKYVHQVYVPQEIADAIRTATGYGTRREGAGPVISSLYRMSALTKLQLVLYSPIAHPRNASSTGMLYAAAAMLSPGGWRGMKLGWEAGGRQIWSALSYRNQAWVAQRDTTMGKRMVDVLNEYGVLGDGGRIGAMYDLFRHGLGFQGSTASTAHKLLKPAKRGHHVVQELFRLEDEGVKASAMYNFAYEYLKYSGENPKLIDAYLRGETLMKAEMALVNEAWKVASEKTLDVLPTFSRSPEAIKGLSRNPVFGAFPTFQSEVARTFKNNIKYNLMLVAGRQANGKKIKGIKNRTEAAAYASARLGALAAVSQGMVALSWMTLQATLGTVGAAFSGLADDDDDLMARASENLRTLVNHMGDYYDPSHQMLRNLFPWYMKDALVGVHNIDPEKGTMDIVSYDYASPFGGWNNAISGVFARYNEAVRTGDERILEKTALSIAEGLGDLFANEEPLLSALITRYLRKANPDMDANAVAKLADTVDAYMEERWEQDFAGAAAGAAIESFGFERVVEFLKDMQDNVASMTDVPENQSAISHALEVAQQMNWGSLVGFKTMNWSVQEHFAKRMESHKWDLSDANSALMRELSKPHESFEDLEATLHVYSAPRKAAFDNAYGAIAAARDYFGMSPTDINEVMTGQIVGGWESMGGLEVSQLMTGDYTNPHPNEVYRRMEELVKKGKVSEEQMRKQLEWYNELYFGVERRPQGTDVPIKKQIRDELIKEEGRKLTAYPDPLNPDDPNKITIGYGHVMSPEEKLKFGTKITGAEAEALLDKDLGLAWQSASRLPVGEFNKLPVNVQKALTNMVFQMGHGTKVGVKEDGSPKYNGVLGFENMLKHIREGNWKSAATEALDSTWAKQTPQRAKRMAAMIRSAGNG